jgi:HSP20 family protein
MNMTFYITKNSDAMNRLVKRAPQRTQSSFRSPIFPSFWDDDFFGRNFLSRDRDIENFVPAVNVSEDEKAWHVEVSAPGFKKDDFAIRLENDVLTISAEQKQENESNEMNYRSREFRYGSFSRSFRLDRETVNEEQISASYENGILNVALPKSEKAAKPAAKEIRIA